MSGLSRCLEGITVPDFDGDLTCTLPDTSEFPWRTPGWCIVELLPLWHEADIVGSFVDLAGIDGQLAQAVYRTGTRYDLDLLVTGAMQPNEDYTVWTPYANPWAGLEANLELLRTNVLAPLEVGDGTRPHTMTMPSGSTRTADVTVTPRLDLQDKLGWVHLYTLTFAVAGGRFA